MDSPSKTDAKKDQFVGSVKENVGHTLGDESMESKGNAQNSSGHVQETAATVSSYISGAVEQASGMVKGAVNSLTGNNSGEAANKVEENKGEAKKEWNSST